MPLSSGKSLPRATPRRLGVGGYLRIGEVAQLVGISSSALRSWEALGLIQPQRSRSRYRLYTQQDVQLLKRAYFWRRVRGLNPAAIIHLLRGQGRMRRTTPAPARLLGPQLRRLRRSRGVSLAAVARATDLSVGFLSALERGQMSASVATLRRLAGFYSTSILALFDPSAENPRLVRPGNRKVLETGPGVRMELLAWGNTAMEPHLFRIAPGAGSGEAYAHDGEEFLYILRGQLQIRLNEEESYRLRPGDSFYFESSTPHRWQNPGRKETWLLWVNTPPTF